MSSTESRLSIVFLIQNLLAIPPQRFQQITVRADHLIEPPDVGVHSGPIADNSRKMVLHIATQSLPFRSSLAERWQEIKIGVLLCELLDLFAIVNVLFVAHAEHQPELTSLMA